jgi:hypothetical protein
MQDTPFHHLIVSHQLRTVYAPVPKAACTSIKGYMRRLMGLPPLAETAVHDRLRNGFAYPSFLEPESLLRIFTSARPAGYFRFTVVRNPFARIASAYRDLVWTDGSAPPRGGSAVETIRLDYCNRTNRRPSDVPVLTLRQFVEAISLSDARSLNRHWQLQATLTCVNLVRYDAVVKLEELAKGQHAIMAGLGVEEALVERLNVTRQRPDNAGTIDEKSADIIRAVYARDFRRFGYDPAVIPPGC